MNRFQLALLFSLACTTILAQEIQNVQASQSGDQVTVTYDLLDEANKTYYVKLFMSKDGGSSFSNELKYLSGDTKNVKPGEGRRITWNAKQEVGYFEGTASFKVEASVKSVPLPDPFVNQCVRVELTNVTNKNGNVKVDFTVTAINKDCELAIFPNQTYLIDAASNQFKASLGNLGDTKLNAFKHAVKDIPIKGQLAFNQTDAGATTIPLLQILVAPRNGCGSQYKDQENTISFKNVLAEKMKYILLTIFALLTNWSLAQTVTGISNEITLSIGNGKSSANITGVSEQVILSIGLNSEKTITGTTGQTKLSIGTTSSTGTSKGTTEAKPVVNDRIEGVPTYFALFIGIDKYQFASPALANLDKPVKDATELKEILLKEYAFTQSNSFFLSNPTRTEILQSLEKLSTLVTAKDNLLIFYAGHGNWDEKLKVGYWLPADAKSNDKSNWIANSTIRDYISGIQSKHTLLISDACFSGGIFKTREVKSEINEYAVSKIYKLPSRKAMTSGTLTIVPDESKFMQFLIKRLSENEDKYLTTRQLFYSLEVAVLNNTNAVPQFGVIQDTGDEGGDFIFIKRD